MDQAQTPPAVSGEAALTCDPRRLPSHRSGHPPPPTLAQLSPSLGLRLDLEERQAGGSWEMRGEKTLRTRLKSVSVWKASFKTLSWFQLIDCSGRFCDEGNLSALGEEAKTGREAAQAGLSRVRPLGPLPSTGSS